MVLLNIAGLVKHKSGGGYSAKSDQWQSMFGEYELNNDLSCNYISGIFGGK